MRVVPAFCLLMAVPALVAQEGNAFPYLSVMPNYELLDNESDCITREFDACELWDGKKWVTREGKYYYRNYVDNREDRQTSVLQIGRNITNAIKASGGTLLFQGAAEPEGRKEYLGGDYHVYAKAAVKGKTVWLLCMIGNGGLNYCIHAIEEEAMVQSITASAMAEALAKDGFIALDIHFDTNKATIKPESQPIVDQIADLLKKNPGLKVSIEGHTDNTGTPEKNKKLSEERAQSVMTAVIAKGVAAGRLSAKGWGQENPVSDNRTEEGRAKNRRVEIVKR